MRVKVGVFDLLLGLFWLYIRPLLTVSVSQGEARCMHGHAIAFEGGVVKLEAEVDTLAHLLAQSQQRLADNQQRFADSLQRLADSQQKLADSKAQAQRLEAACHQSHAQLAAMAGRSAGILRDLKAELQANALDLREQIAGSVELVGEVEAEVAQAMMRQHRQGQEDARALQEAHGEAERRAAGMQELRVEIAALQQQVAALQQQAREDEVGLKRASEVLMDLQKVVMERDAAQDQARLAQLRVEGLEAEVQRLEQEAVEVAGRLELEATQVAGRLLYREQEAAEVAGRVAKVLMLAQAIHGEVKVEVEEMRQVFAECAVYWEREREREAEREREIDR